MESSSSGERWGWIMERNLIYPKRNSTKPNVYKLGKSGVMGWVASPKRYIHIPPWYLWIWPLWINRVIGVASHPMNGVLIKGGNTMWQQTQRENSLWGQTETGEPQLWAKGQGWMAITRSGRDQAGSFPRAFTGSVALPTPGFGTSRLQGCGREYILLL